MAASELARIARVVAVSPSDVQAERDRLDCERTIGPQYPSTDRAGCTLAVSYTLGARAELAASYSRAGRTDALELLRRVLADCERVLASEHPVTLSVRRALADRDADRRAAG